MHPDDQSDEVDPVVIHATCTLTEINCHGCTACYNSGNPTSSCVESNAAAIEESGSCF